MLQIENIRAYCNDDTIYLTEHLLSRMRQRSIKLEDIKNTITEGEIIEQYQDDYPFPSCLISSKKMHVVCSLSSEYLYIITAYRPSIEQWDAEGMKRKENNI